jgi:hypothetical protein
LLECAISWTQNLIIVQPQICLFVAASTCSLDNTSQGNFRLIYSETEGWRRRWEYSDDKGSETVLM